MKWPQLCGELGIGALKLISSAVICSTNFSKWEPGALKEANPRSNCVIINFILVLHA